VTEPHREFLVGVGPPDPVVVTVDLPARQLVKIVGRIFDDLADQPVVLRETANGYEAVEASGERETSGNPYVAVVNLLDSMTEDDITFDVRFGGDSDESLS
jgi:hypothetical protein